MTATAAEPVEATWPSPTFLKDAQRLRSELEKAIRLENDFSERIGRIQDAAFTKGLPVALVAGGPDVLKKLSAERDAATLAVNDKRAELRQFLAASRAGFFALRDKASANLHTGVSERFARAQKLAEELCDLLVGSLGVEAECARQEVLIRAWNRLVAKYCRTIPSTNINSIPSAVGLDYGECLRARIEGLLVQNSSIRQLCREILVREKERRDRATAFEEAKIDERERLANPAALAEPF